MAQVTVWVVLAAVMRTVTVTARVVRPSYRLRSTTERVATSLSVIVDEIQRERLEKHWKQKLQRARYDVELAERQFVDEEEPRIGEQHPSERQHLLLSAAQGSRILAAAFGQAREHGEDAIHALPNFCSVVANIESAELEIFPHRQERKNTTALGNERNAELATLIRGHRRNVLAGK